MEQYFPGFSGSLAGNYCNRAPAGYAVCRMVKSASIIYPSRARNSPLLGKDPAPFRCDNHHARAAATQQLRYWHPHLPNAIDLLRKAANDSNGIVRMEAAIAASYFGSREALDALLEPASKGDVVRVYCRLAWHQVGRQEKDVARAGGR